MSAQERLRVLIAENHRDLGEAMRCLVDGEPDMQCVGRVERAEEVSGWVRETAADALILDLMLQGGGGMDLLEELSASFPELRIVVFSGLANSKEFAREALRRGAAAYVTKGSDFRVLLDELRGAARS